MSDSPRPSKKAKCWVSEGVCYSCLFEALCYLPFSAQFCPQKGLQRNSLCHTLQKFHFLHMPEPLWFWSYVIRTGREDDLFSWQSLPFDDLPCPLYKLPRGTVTKEHRPDSLKQEEFILLRIQTAESETKVWIEWTSSRGCMPVSWLLVTAGNPWLSYPPSLYFCLCLHTGPFCVCLWLWSTSISLIRTPAFGFVVIAV